MSDLDQLHGVDLAALVPLGPPRTDFLGAVAQRADARALRGVPLSPAERFGAFARFGFRPHGLYVPTDREAAAQLFRRLWGGIGTIPSEDQRLAEYAKLQAETAYWERQGVEGAWNGQQAVARCLAQFRITGWGRRAGKTEYAAAEGAAYLELRPGCTVWVAARTMKLVSRCFDLIEDIVRRMGWEVTAHRNSRDERYLELANGSRVEGVSLDNVGERDSAAGVSVALAIIDEGAQVIREAWTRAIYPPLTDRGGQALILSSFQGEANWFYQQIEHLREHPDPAWAVFILESWHNFYVHPMGRVSPTLVQAQRDCDDPLEFLEQYAAVPRRGRYLVFPQYRDRVHALRPDEIPFDASRPVILTGDPSGGANPYAVLAVQRYPERPYQEHQIIDEYYVAGAITEDVAADLNRRPWRPNVVEMVIDGAHPHEVERWARLGYPVFGIEDKPRPEDRHPVYRRLLRDPLRFQPYYLAHLGAVLEEHDLSWAQYNELEPVDQQPFLILVEERLSDDRLGPDDIQVLRECSHIAFNRDRCLNTIKEHKQYAYEPPRRAGQSRPERARKWHDHAMDALGYYAWHYTRHEYYEGLDVPAHTSHSGLITLGNVAQYGLVEALERPTQDPERLYREPRVTLGWLQQMRAQHAPRRRRYATSSLRVH